MNNLMYRIIRVILLYICFAVAGCTNKDISFSIDSTSYFRYVIYTESNQKPESFFFQNLAVKVFTDDKCSDEVKKLEYDIPYEFIAGENAKFTGENVEQLNGLKFIVIKVDGSDALYEEFYDDIVEQYIYRNNINTTQEKLKEELKKIGDSFVDNTSFLFINMVTEDDIFISENVNVETLYIESLNIDFRFDSFSIYVQEKNKVNRVSEEVFESTSGSGMLYGGFPFIDLYCDFSGFAKVDISHISFKSLDEQFDVVDETNKDIYDNLTPYEQNIQFYKESHYKLPFSIACKDKSGFQYNNVSIPVEVSYETEGGIYTEVVHPIAYSSTADYLEQIIFSIYEGKMK